MGKPCKGIISSSQTWWQIGRLVVVKIDLLNDNAIWLLQVSKAKLILSICILLLAY